MKIAEDTKSWKHINSIVKHSVLVSQGAVTNDYTIGRLKTSQIYFLPGRWEVQDSGVAGPIPSEGSGWGSFLPARDIRDMGSIPGSGKYPGGGHGNPFQYSCLENPMGRGVWWAMIHRVAKSRTGLKWLSMHTHTSIKKRIKKDNNECCQGWETLTHC